MGKVVELPVRVIPDEDLFPVLLPSQVLPDPDDLVGPVAVDTETTGLFVDDGATVAVVSVGYSTADKDELIQSVAFPFDLLDPEGKGFAVKHYKDGREYARFDPADPREAADVNLPETEWRTLCDWLVAAGAEVGLMNQHMKFDQGQMYNGTRQFSGVDLDPYMVWDTMLASKHLDPLHLTGLKPTGARLFGPEAADEAEVLKLALLTIKKRYGLVKDDGPRYDLVPWQVLGPYAAQDTTLALMVWRDQFLRMHSGEGDWSALQRQFDFSDTLRAIERRGLGPFDVEACEPWARKLETRLRALEKKLPFQPPTANSAREYFFDRLGIAPWQASEERRVWGTNARTGKPKIEVHGALTMNTARRMAVAGVPYAKEYGELLRLQTANRMHYRGYIDLSSPKDRKLRTNYRQAYVKSGRISVERFQAQALPKHLGMVLDGLPVPEPRSFFTVPEGKVRANLDLGQAELRIAALLAGCESMSRVLAAQGDLHGQAAERIFGINKEHPDWKAKRDVAKRTVFGGVFLIGAKTFQATLFKDGLFKPLAECKEIVYAFRNAYPEYKTAYEYWDRYVSSHRYVPTLHGERSWFKPYEYSNSGWSRRVQGTLAVFNTDWLNLVERMTRHLDALVLTVHDSVVLELPEDQAEEITQQVQDATIELWEKSFGIPGRVDAGPWFSP